MRSATELNLDAPWRKASRSNNGADSCVEVAPLVGTDTALRDSKDPDGPALVVGKTAFGTFLRHLKTGALDT